MGIRGIYRLIMLMLAVAIVAFATLAYVGWVGMREENRETAMSLEKLTRHMQKLEADKEYKKEYFYRLLHDQRFADHVIREKLGFVGDGEIVFRFEDSNPVEIDGVPVAKESPAKQSAAPTQSEQIDKSQNYQYSSDVRRESMLDRLMFWKYQSVEDDSDENPAPQKSAPELRIDLLAEDADKAEAKTSPAEPSAKRPEVNFSMPDNNAQSAGKTSESDLNASSFTKAHTEAGELKESDSKIYSLKLGASTGGSSGRTAHGSIKEIKFEGRVP